MRQQDRYVRMRNAHAVRMRNARRAEQSSSLSHLTPSHTFPSISPILPYLHLTNLNYTLPGPLAPLFYLTLAGSSLEHEREERSFTLTQRAR